MQNLDQANSQAEVILVDAGEDFEIVDLAINLEDDIASVVNLKTHGTKTVN